MLLFALLALLPAVWAQKVNTQHGSCNLQQSIDYVGNDTLHVSGAGLADCCDLCDRSPDCAGFTWTELDTGTCWLKSIVGYDVVNDGATSAIFHYAPPACTLQLDVDFEDNDIASRAASAAEDCCEICRNWPGCKAFSWSDFAGGTCWLKSAKGTEIATTGVTSAVVEGAPSACSFESNTDYVDNDIANTPGVNANECAGICYNWAGCRAFTWSDHEGGTCWLKSGKGTTATTSGVTSCQLRDNDKELCALEAGVDYVENDIGSQQAPYPGECCEICRNYDGCYAFSWTDQNGGTCWLKRAKGDTVQDTDVVSAQVW